MFFSKKNIVGTNTDIIDIVGGYAQAGCLKSAGFDNLRVCLPLTLSFGDLLELDSYSRDSLKELYCEDYYPFENKYDFKSEMKLLKDEAEKASLIRVWSSHLNCDDYLLLLYICKCFPNKKISAIFSEEFNWNSLSIGMMDGKEMKELIKREHILTNNQINGYIREWDELVKVNSKLRYIVNGKVISVNDDYFDKIILDMLSKYEEIHLNRFIGELIGNQVINDAGDALYRYLINNLINKGSIAKYSKNGKIYIKLLDDSEV